MHTGGRFIASTAWTDWGFKQRARYCPPLGGEREGFSTAAQYSHTTGNSTGPIMNRGEMQMRILLVLACMSLASSLVGQDCVKNARGETVCGNGKSAAAYNPNTGKAAASQRNSNGVATTKTSTGGEAKTKNGKGVAQGPGGTVCAKGENKQGCTKK